MAVDNTANFAVGTILTAPSPATSGTSLVLNSAQGTRFPAAPFNVVLVAPGSAPDTYFTTAEIVRVTTVATDTFTIVRAQEGTTARTVLVGWYVLLAPTAKLTTEIETIQAMGAL